MPDGVGVQTTVGERAALDAFYMSTLGEQWLRSWDVASLPCEVSIALAMLCNTLCQKSLFLHCAINSALKFV